LGELDATDSRFEFCYLNADQVRHFAQDPALDLSKELAERIGITMANLSILKSGKAKAVRFTTLEAICRELSCQPGDLFEYQPADSDDKEV
jgi:putative transcriptional regulator